jgi:hypothetical protein
VPAFHQVAYAEAWPGIAVAYQRAGAGLKSSFHLAPGADPSAIRLAYRGGEVRVAEDGALEVVTPLGVLRESAPVAWQDGRGGREPVSVRWTMLAGTDDIEVGFKLGAYDRARALVIDPTLLYASYLGGDLFDTGSDITVDSSGAAYVTGITLSTQATFPDGDPNANDQFDVPGFDPTFNGPAAGQDAYVAKLSPDGRSLVYATYLGGSAYDSGNGIAVDGTGAAYVTGRTESTQASFPIGAAPGFDQTHNGGSDAFVLKLAPNGQSLIYATYLGGSAGDDGEAIAVNGNGEVYVVGETSSDQTTFPDGDPNGNDQIEAAGFDRTYNGLGDVFAIKLTANGQGLSYATYIGGGLSEFAAKVVLDASGAAYIVGQTQSTQTTFPDGDPNANDLFDVPGFDQTFNGAAADFDVFVVKLAPSGQSLAYATYLGGNNVDVGYGIAVDGNGSAYVTGYARSTQATFPNGTGFASLSPAVPGFDQTQNGDADAYVVKLAPDGQSLVYATYLGGSLYDQGSDIAVDSSGAAYILGFTDSTQSTFPNGTGIASLSPTVPGFDQTQNGGQDTYLVKLAPNGQSLLDATFIGGSEQDQGLAIALDGNGNAYVVGGGLSTQASFPSGNGFAAIVPAVPGFDQTYNGGDDDAFVVKFGPTATPTSIPPTFCSPRPNVLVITSLLGGGRLGVTLRAQALPVTPNNALTFLQIGALTNAQVTVGGQTVQTGQVIALAAGAQEVALVVQRQTPGQATTAHLVVTDVCGEWRTFVGGGPTAF